MKPELNSGRGGLSDFLLIPPVAALVALGMVLPEYWLTLVVSALVAMLLLAVIQKINRRGARVLLRRAAGVSRLVSFKRLDAIESRVARNRHVFAHRDSRDARPLTPNPSPAGGEGRIEL